MDSNLGNRGILWSVLGGELLDVVFDLRYMLMFSIVLILADFWWGHSESMKRYHEAERQGRAIIASGWREKK